MNPYPILAGLVLVIAAYFGGMHVGSGLEEAKWQKEKLNLQAAQQAAILVEVNQRDADRLASEAKARKASEKYETALTAKDTNYAAEIAAVRRAGGLRIPATTCAIRQAASGPEAPGARGPDEVGASTIELPDRTQERLFNLTSRADALAEQLRALQGWIVDNGFYGEASDGVRHPDQ